MRYDVRRRVLTLGRRACRHCQQGKVARRINCPDCGGTGRGPRGGEGGCGGCGGLGDAYDWNRPVVCDYCLGEWRNGTAETWSDRVPPETMQHMPLQVVRLSGDSAARYGQPLLVVKDYGAASRMTDEQLIPRVRKRLMDEPPMGTKVTPPMPGMAPRRQVVPGLVVGVMRDGYSVRAMTLVTRPDPATEPRKKRTPIGETPVGVCPNCHLVHIPGECM